LAASFGAPPEGVCSPEGSLAPPPGCWILLTKGVPCCDCKFLELPSVVAVFPEEEPSLFPGFWILLLPWLRALEPFLKVLVLLDEV